MKFDVATKNGCDGYKLRSKISRMTICMCRAS